MCVCVYMRVVREEHEHVLYSISLFASSFPSSGSVAAAASASAAAAAAATSSFLGERGVARPRGEAEMVESIRDRAVGSA